MKILQEFRKWLDGEDVISRTPQQQAQLSEWDEFFVRIAREVETVMKREMFTPPGGPTYLPGEYIIYLSKEDDQLWQGRKRDGLEEGLRHGLTQRARELVGDKVLKTDKIALSLGIDGTLPKGQVRVQAVWDDDSPKTEVTARKKRPLPAAPEPAPAPAAENEADEGDKTLVRPRAPLFSIRYSRPGEEPQTFPSLKSKVEIGRGSKDFHVDLKLDGDPEISRKQVILTRLDTGAFKLECVGRNSIDIEGREIQPGEHTEIQAGQTIKLGIYEFQIIS
ncbi:MAG: FHA domain-containing protein [Blastocatellia bacterium]|nr:FHA domain-containing protein [Blastocatellia bacterium]